MKAETCSVLQKNIFTIIFVCFMFVLNLRTIEQYHL